MLLVDDLIFRSLGISVPVFDLFWTFEQIQKYSMKEFYNPEKIKSKIKENRLLYEFGEISRENYERMNADLMRQLKMAERALEMDLGGRSDILGRV
jgi:hypothetical protein